MGTYRTTEELDMVRTTSFDFDRFTIDVTCKNGEVDKLKVSYGNNEPTINTSDGDMIFKLAQAITEALENAKGDKRK